MDLGLQDRVVLVTGGSSGVGLATLRLLHAEGARVATCARDGDRLDKALAEAGLTDDRVLAQPADVRDSDSVDALLAAVTRRFGALDGLVNNAGGSRMQRLQESTAEDWRDELELKFSGVLNPTSAALPLLRQSTQASIVNVNAVLSVQPETWLAVTSAARAGVLNLSRSMADELAADGIRVNSVCLGLVDTGQWRRRHAADPGAPDYAAWQAALAADRRIPLGRLGRAEEVADVIAFLLSARASYLTGGAIDVAGGLGRSIH